jgi:hypothetical protein
MPPAVPTGMQAYSQEASVLGPYFKCMSQAVAWQRLPPRMQCRLEFLNRAVPLTLLLCLSSACVLSIASHGSIEASRLPCASALCVYPTFLPLSICLADCSSFACLLGVPQGCGLITYVDRQCAASAIAQLHGKYVFPGSDCPMVVEWMDLKKQRPVGEAAALLVLALGVCLMFCCLDACAWWWSGWT